MALIRDIQIGLSVNSKDFVAKLKSAEQRLGQFGKVAGKIGSTLAVLDGAKLAFDGLKAAVTRATELEKTLTGLSKAANLEGAGLAGLKGELFSLATELKGVKLDDLLEIATSGAKMGIATEGLVEYTRGVAMLSTAVDDVPAATLADQIGTLNSVFKLGNRGALQMGSALDKIADSGLSSASGILDVTARIAGTANAMKIGAGESMAMAAALLDTGTQAEQAASSINNLMMNMVAVGNHADFAKTAGVSVEQFGAMVANKPMKAIQAFLAGLQKLDAAGQLEALEGAGIKAQERQSAIQKLAQQTDKLASYTAMAADEFQTLNQITASYNATAKTTAAAWDQFGNRIDTISETLGSTFLPAVNSALDGIGEKLDQANRAAKLFIDTLKSIPMPELPGGAGGPSLGGAFGEGLATSALGPLGLLANLGLSAVGTDGAATPWVGSDPAAMAKAQARSKSRADAVRAAAENSAIESIGGPPAVDAKTAKARAKAEAAAKKKAEDAARRQALALKEQGEAVIEATRTPMEQYQARLGELNKLLAGKAIDSTTFARAKVSAREDIFGDSNEPRFAGATRAGSADAYSAQLRFMAQGQSKDEPIKDVAKKAGEQLDVQKQLLVSFNKVADKLGSAVGSAAAELFAF